MRNVKQFSMFGRLDPFHCGRRLAHLLHVDSVADDDVPQPKHLVYRTRRVHCLHVREHHACVPVGSVPSLYVVLDRLDVRCWWGRPVRLWRVSTAVTLLAGPYPVVLSAAHSFAHESSALRWFGEVADVWSQITDIPQDGWINPAPWRPNPVPVGAAAAFWQPADREDLSDLFWLAAFGVHILVRLTGDGVYVHVDPSEVDPVHGPLVIEVPGAGLATYGTDHRAPD